MFVLSIIFILEWLHLLKINYKLWISDIAMQFLFNMYLIELCTQGCFLLSVFDRIIIDSYCMYSVYTYFVSIGYNLKFILKRNWRHIYHFSATTSISQLRLMLVYLIWIDFKYFLCTLIQVIWPIYISYN